MRAPPMSELDNLLSLHESGGAKRSAPQPSAPVTDKRARSEPTVPLPGVVWSATQGPATPRVDLEIEPFSGLRVTPKTRNLSRDDMVALSKGFAVRKLPEVPQLLRQPATTLSATAWLTIGVLAERGAAKPTQNGGKFCVWKVYDLRPNGTTISVFLFGEVCEVAWKYLPGNVCAFLSPRALPPKEGGGPSSEAAMSIEKQAQLVRVGQVTAPVRTAPFTCVLQPTGGMYVVWVGGPRCWRSARRLCDGRRPTLRCVRASVATASRAGCG